MNQTHIHLLVNHLGIVGTILASFVLGYGIWMKSDQTKIAAYLLFVVSAIGGIVTYVTGEAAEETVENISGISDKIVEAHEEFAVVALVAIGILALLSLLAVFLTGRKTSWNRPFSWLLLIFSLITFAVMARTGYLGGQIRHTELTTVAPTGQPDTGPHDE
jgi:uncharacterized membrane protein